MELKRIEPEEIASLEIVQKLQSFRLQLDCNFGTSHGNSRLELMDVLRNGPGITSRFR